MQIISCKNSMALATKIAETKNFELIKTKTQSFTGGELKIEMPKTLAKEIYIIQSFNQSVNDGLIELFLTINAARSSGASKINIIAPYLPYSRQDKNQSMSSCGFKTIADLLNSCNINRLITLDFHAPYALNLLTSHVTNISIEKLILPLAQNRTIICPDNGSAKRNRFDRAIILHKKRINNNVTFELNDDIKGLDCFIIDDIIDSGKTICLAAQILKNNGARSIHAYATHGLLPKTTYKKLNESFIEKLYISNSIETDLLSNNINILDIAKIIVNNF